MYQKITIMGYLGRDPELRHSEGNDPVTNLDVATTEHWKDANGERQSRTTWMRVAVWGAQAEACNNHLSKGSRVLIVGKITEPNVWQDKEGNYRADIRIRSENVVFANDMPQQEEGAQQQQRQTTAPAAAAPQQQQQRFGGGNSAPATGAPSGGGPPF